jgi:TetR/AcrR family transcriptional regulator
LVNTSRRMEKYKGSQEKIMQAAIELFARNGYAATSVREIVAKAGVTKPVLYYYFGNKEGLLKSIIDFADDLQESLNREALNFQGPTRDRIANLVSMTMASARRNRDLVRMMSGLVHGPVQEDYQHIVGRFIQRSLETMTVIYDEGLERGDVAEANRKAVAWLLMSLRDFSVMYGVFSPLLCDATDPIDMLDVVFTGLRKRDI